MRQGLTVIWVGWQFDVPRDPGLLRLQAPIAGDGGQPIEGLVRSDWTLDAPTATLPLAHRHHVPYPVADPGHADNVLTVRSSRLGPREIVPRDRWRFARMEDGRLVDDRTEIALAGGFERDKIYELVYRARDPVVVGIGLAVVRDIVSWARYDARSPFPVTAFTRPDVSPMVMRPLPVVAVSSAPARSTERSPLPVTTSRRSDFGISTT